MPAAYHAEDLGSSPLQLDDFLPKQMEVSFNKKNNVKTFDQQNWRMLFFGPNECSGRRSTVDFIKITQAGLKIGPKQDPISSTVCCQFSWDPFMLAICCWTTHAFQQFVAELPLCFCVKWCGDRTVTISVKSTVRSHPPGATCSQKTCKQKFDEANSRFLQSISTVSSLIHPKNRWSADLRIRQAAQLRSEIYEDREHLRSDHLGLTQECCFTGPLDPRHWVCSSI